MSNITPPSQPLGPFVAPPYGSPPSLFPIGSQFQLPGGPTSPFPSLGPPPPPGFAGPPAGFAAPAPLTAPPTGFAAPGGFPAPLPQPTGFAAPTGLLPPVATGFPTPGAAATPFAAPQPLASPTGLAPPTGPRVPGFPQTGPLRAPLRGPLPSLGPGADPAFRAANAQAQALARQMSGAPAATAARLAPRTLTQRLAALRASRLGRFGLPIAAVFGGDYLGDLIARQNFPGSGRLGSAAELGLTAGGVTRSPLVGGLAAAFGLATGAELEDIPGIGRFFEGGPSVDDAKKEASSHLRTVLSDYGADTGFVNDMERQLRLVWDVQDPQDADAVSQLTQQVLTDALQQFSLLQNQQQVQQQPDLGPGGPIAQQIDDERAYYQSAIAAAQAWMEPIVQQQLDLALQNANVYQDLGTAYAGQVQDPQLRAALTAQAATFPALQANQNAITAQQALTGGDQLSQQIEELFAQQQLQLQQQDLATQQMILQAQQQGLLPGGGPTTIGGLPYAPAGG